MTAGFQRWLVAAACVVWVGCSSDPGAVEPPKPVTADNHPAFPITASSKHALGSGGALDGPIDCASCHPSTAESPKDIACTGCHKHTLPMTDRLHLGFSTGDLLAEPDAGYANDSRSCYRCHPTGVDQPFHHYGIPAAPEGACATCHGEAAAFARLPRADGQPHLAVTGDCGGCHQRFDAWTGATGAEDGRFDPARDWSVTGWLPSFAGPVITRVQPSPQLLHMPMNHRAAELDAGLVADCALCHLNLDQGGGSYFPGVFHTTLTNLRQPQPTRCLDCHATTEPVGFVGPTQATRSPASPEMRHDALAWDGGTRLSPAECSVCHAMPSRVSSQWNVALADGGPPAFHAPLTGAGLGQPASCLGCHANSRPVTPLTSTTAALPAGLSFDHGANEALGDCGSCHASTTAWTGGRFHASAGTPSTCLPCHEGERPTSTTGWQSTTYTRSPFDYGTNADGIGHGANEDCAVCHATSTSSWVGGVFSHGPGTIAATTCSACHVSQRPTMPVPNGATPFDHQVNGMGECRGCHRATVTAGRYVDYFNPMTGMLPGGDWRGGLDYPADVLVTSPTQYVSILQFTLQRTPPDGGFVTGMTSAWATFYNAMLHTSTVIPSAVTPGTATARNPDSCWHCHTNVDGGVTSLIDGRFHAALAGYQATPGGVVSPLPQPTSRCIECHEPMRPGTLVLKGADAGNALQPMDHSARFTMALTLGGQSVTSVAQADCSVCHQTDAGSTWTDGRFHAHVAGAAVTDCAGCHYPLMASAAADVLLDGGVTAVMKHRSVEMTFQRCDTCHTQALGKADTGTAVTLWKPAQLHARVAAQPVTCAECHSLSEPAMSTQGSVVWTFTSGGGTATNGGQWMNHAPASVTSRDCGVCHASDASATPQWTKSMTLHRKVGGLGACGVCHGTANGRGTTLGTNNNIPVGRTNSSTVTTASNAPGVLDQLSHADVNVTSRDCGACHQLVAPPATVQSWKSTPTLPVRFHANFTSASPLLINGTTGRCSTCHLNLKPGPTFTAFDHAAFTDVSGTPDCGTCHAYPGTSAAMPNWLGAAAVPATISVGGFPIPAPPAATAGTNQTGIANLPHPVVGTGVTCTTCHTQAAGGRRAFGYDHLSTLINTKCNACHEAGSDLIGTSWNGSTTEAGGAGDSRPFTLVNVTTSYKGNAMTVTYPKHFYPVDCAQCHVVPPGNGFVTTGAAYTTAWRFPHTESKMTNPSTCLMCHTRGVPN